MVRLIRCRQVDRRWTDTQSMKSGRKEDVDGLVFICWCRTGQQVQLAEGARFNQTAGPAYDMEFYLLFPQCELRPDT